ncbi:MAG TPA: hypothetical protein VM942_11540 [Acidimicrobiales bacterium]|nr:hypothetical protein [Acidimicrobiales bacterium]
MNLSFGNLLVVAVIAVSAPLLVGLVPSLRVPAGAGQLQTISARFRRSRHHGSSALGGEVQRTMPWGSVTSKVASG